MRRYDGENPPRTVASTWRVGQLIGNGGHSAVYEAQNIFSRESVAVKFAFSRGQMKKLRNEVMVYMAIAERLPNDPGFLKFIHFDALSSAYRALVLEKGGLSIHKQVIYNLQNGIANFSLRAVFTFGIQLIEILKRFHSLGFIHCDIKNNNILFKRNSFRALLIDFGCSRRYRSLQGNYVRSNRPGIITPYSSLAVSLGQEPGRKDDLESLGYCLVFMFKHNLPWSFGEDTISEDEKLIISEQERANIQGFTSGMGRGMQRYFQHLRSLDCEAVPDYNFLIQCLS